MAKRGVPLPFAKRQEIKTLRETMGIKRTARALELSRNTVRKYSQAQQREHDYLSRFNDRPR
jgi:transposase-like protein